MSVVLLSGKMGLHRWCESETFNVDDGEKGSEGCIELKDLGAERTVGAHPDVQLSLLLL